MKMHVSGDKLPNIRYEYSRKPVRCPACKRKSIATILYGYPDFPTVEKDLEEGRITLGGCCVIIGEPQPVWECTSCGALIYKKKRKS